MRLKRAPSTAFAGVLLAAVLVVLGAAPAYSATGGRTEIPKFQYAYGVPMQSIVPPMGWSSGPDTGIAPPLAVDASRIYFGGESINVFDRSGEPIDFWPVSSAVTGLGAPSTLCEWTEHQSISGEGPSPTTARDLALAPGGGLYVLDRGYASVSYYTPSGRFAYGWVVPAPPGDYSRPAALAVSDDGSVYTLELAAARIYRFTADGSLLNEWEVPAGEQFCTRGGDLAAAPSGVWHLNYCCQLFMPGQLTRYSADGMEQVTIEVGHTVAITADGTGGVWALAKEEGVATARRFDASGVLVEELPVGAGARSLAVAPTGELLALVEDRATLTPSVYRMAVPIFGVRTYDGTTGAEVGAFGSAADYFSRGALLHPYFSAATPAGDIYVHQGGQGDWVQGSEYTTHFDACGRVVEVINEPGYPYYSPVTQQIELAPQWVDGVESDGTPFSFWATAEWTPDETPEGHVNLTLQKLGLDGSVLAESTMQGPQAAAPLGPCCFNKAFARAPDGTWRFVYSADGYQQGDGSGTLPPVLWVGTLDADLSLVSAWQTVGPAAYGGIASVAVDPSDDLYLGGYRGVWKYSSAGLLIGRVGGWGGVGDQRDAPGSLTRNALALHLDAVGNLRVMDYGASRVLLFSPPGAKP